MVKIFPFNISSANTVAAADEQSNSEKNDEVQASRWTRAKPYCFCCMRYGCAGIVGALIAVGIVLIVLWQIGLFGGKKGSSPSVIDLGELPYPRVSSGYTEVNVTLSPVAAALAYKPKYYVLESQPAVSTSGRFLADNDGSWAINSKVNYESVPVVAEIAGLAAGTSIIVRYRIEMDDGRLSSPSVSVLASLLPPAAPSAPGLAAYNTSTSSVSVLVVPPASVHGSNITSYGIRYKVASSTNWTSQTIQVADATKPFTVSGLSPQQNVVFTLTALNGVGSSPSSAEYSMRTDADGASVPGKVGTVTATNITSNSILLHWPPAQDDGAMILRYIITANNQRTVEIDGHLSTGTITGLTRATSYELQVHAVNSKGDGSASDPITVKTKDLCSADPPSQPTIQTVFADGLSVRWYPPQNPTCDLPISGYRVVWSDGNGVACTPSDGLNFCDITGLSNQKSYSVKVQSKNEAGWSDHETPALTATTLPKAPTGVGCNTRDQVRWWKSVTNNDGSSLYYDGQRFSQQMVACGKSKFGDKKGVSECMRDYTSVPSGTPFNLPAISRICANLIGTLMECGRDHCITQCVSDPAASECIECNKENCNPAFYHDGGLTPGTQPENPK